MEKEQGFVKNFMSGLKKAAIYTVLGTSVLITPIACDLNKTPEPAPVPAPNNPDTPVTPEPEKPSYEYGTDKLIINNIKNQEELNIILNTLGDKYKDIASVHADSQTGQTYAFSTNDFNANLDLGLLNDIENRDIVVSLSTEAMHISYNELTKEEFLYIYNNLKLSSGIVNASQYHSNINENNEGYSITISNLTSANDVLSLMDLLANINGQKKTTENITFSHFYGTIEEFKKQLGLGGGRIVFTDYKTPYNTLQEILGDEFYNTSIPVVEQDGVEYPTKKDSTLENNN